MNNTPYSIHANPDSIPVIHSNWYPPVAVTEKNLQYAQILMPDLAAAVSEMTTVHQYLYQSWTAGSNYNNESCKPDSRALHKNIRRVIQRIAVVEQHHFTIIGQLITLLGGQPECRSAEPCSYWRGNMVDYSCDKSQKIKDPQVSKMLARLSLDEKLHYKIFSDFLSQI